MTLKGYISTCLITLFVALSAMGQVNNALIIGISDYPASSGFGKIHGENDCEIIGKMLDNKGFKTATLVNSQATAANIRTELKKLATNSVKGSCVYIHFSCHGQPFEDKPPFDEDDLWDESLIAYDAKINYQSIREHPRETTLMTKILCVVQNLVSAKMANHSPPESTNKVISKLTKFLVYPT